MGACETTPPATPEDKHDPLPASQNEKSLSPLSMITRRPSASSSFVLAAARLRALIALPSRTAA